MLAVWRRIEGQRPPPVEAAIEWLQRQDSHRGVSAREGAPACAGATAALIPTMLEFGQLDMVRAWCDWLLASQLADGSFPRADGLGGSAFNTAQALAALSAMAADGRLSDSTPARRAGDYLAGRLLAGWMPGAGAMYQVRVAGELCCLPALAAAARHFHVPDWQLVVERSVAHARRIVDWRLWQASLRLVPYVADAWLALDEFELACDVLRGVSALQGRDGAVPAVADGRWGDHALLALLAKVWHRLGETDRADRALTFLVKRQLSTGGWHETWGRGEKSRESVWVAKHYLDAAQCRVLSWFSGDAADLPLTIAAEDGRVGAVVPWMAGFEPGAKVADVGCGPGRFLKLLGERFPNVRLLGIDPAEALLSRLPKGTESRRGGLLRLPARDGELDGAFAVESLEHALLPRQAVAELCRVVRPGGRLLIIDKHAGWQALSLSQPWERWFSPEEVAAWLRPYCGEVTVGTLAHGLNRRGAGPFLCWEATRTSG
jgi:SAM-dependent methyltransferase